MTSPEEVRTPRRITPRRVLALMAAMFIWGAIAAPSSVGEEIVEPSELSAYSSFADARPVQTYFDHQAYQIPIGPSLAHSQTELALPSAASGIAWLVDAGLANGLHGTTTGNKVPTEASAKQPGGAETAEFRVAGGPIGDDQFAKVGAGIAGAKAERDETPRGFAYSHFENFVLLPAAGNPEQPPGSFNPENTYPGGEDSVPTPDPQPQGQMAILSVGSVASTAESQRNGSTITSVAVTELKEIAIGNRTSDNRCTNCIRIDSIRAEAFAEANGEPGGARGRYRVVLGRMCRRALDTTQNREIDQCIQPSQISNQFPHDINNQRAVGGAADETEQIERFEEFNEAFEKPIWMAVPGFEDRRIGIRLHAGTPHDDPDRARRTSNPPEDAHRNYGYPDTRISPECQERPECNDKYEEGDPIRRKDQAAPDEDGGTVAKAVAEGIDIELTTLTLTQFVPSDEEIGTALDENTMGVAQDIDEDPKRSGIQITVPEPQCGQDQGCIPPIGAQVGPNQVQVYPVGQVTVGVDNLRTLRRINLTFGVAAASTTVRPTVLTPPAGGGPSDDGGAPPPSGDGGVDVTPPTGGDGTVSTPPASDPDSGTVVIRGNVGGPLKVKLNWAKFRLKPWSPGDQAKGFLSAGIMAGAWALGKRRLKFLS